MVIMVARQPFFVENQPNPLAKVHHSIKAVTRLTGLSVHLLRIWEHRYGAVKPLRTPTNRRLYTPQDVERLKLLRAATQNGHTISLVAQLPEKNLRELIAASDGAAPAVPAGRTVPAGRPGELVNECLTAVQLLDVPGLAAALRSGAEAMGTLDLLQRVITPLNYNLGELWAQGQVTAGQEHFASAVLRTFLGQVAKPYGGSQKAPGLIVATPPGQLHEMGALLVRAVAITQGWNVTYLGASLPAADIALAVRQTGARAVALSLTHPADDEELPGELAQLRQLLPPETEILVGGRVVASYRACLQEIKAIEVNDLAGLVTALLGLRRPVGRGKSGGRAAAVPGLTEINLPGGSETGNG